MTVFSPVLRQRVRCLASAACPAGGLAIAVALGVAVSGCNADDSFGESLNAELQFTDLQFDPTAVRTERRQSVTVRNSGSLPVATLAAMITVEGGAPSDVFFVERVDVQIPIEPGDSFVLPLLFRPLAIEDYTAQLQLFFSDPTATDPVATAVLHGSGVARDACDVHAIGGGDFGPVLIGESGQATVTIRNDGARACDISGARVAQAGDLFTILDGPTQLGASESAAFVIEVTPDSPGPLAGELRFIASELLPTDNVRLDTEVTYALSAEAIENHFCAFEAFPAAVIFPRATTNAPTTSTVAGTVVRNVGNIDCELDSITVTSGAEHFAVELAPASGTLLTPENTFLVELRFAPLAEGLRDGVVTITAVGGASLEVDLHGMADPASQCSVQFSPNPIVFDDLGVGLSVEQEVTITNVSVIDCELLGIEVTSEASADFSIANAPVPLGTLAPDESRSVMLRFSPQTGAPASGQLQVEYGGVEPAFAPVLGFGAFADLRLFPLDWSFGYITEGCASEVLDLTLSNLGPVAARIDSVTFSNFSDPNFQVVSGPAPGTLLDAGDSLTIGARTIGSSAYGGNRGELLIAATGATKPVIGSHLFGESESIAQAVRTEIFLQAAIPKLDVLFVIDDSGSMYEEQQSLAANFAAFIAFFTSDTAVDFHIGVTTTDTDVSTAGELVGPYIDGNTLDPEGTFIQQANVGTNGSADEQGILAGTLAVTPPNASPGGPNDGFIRDDALLSIIYISDEEDYSPGLVTNYVNQIVAVKGNQTDAVIASAIAGPLPNGCFNSGTGAADAGTRYANIVAQLGGRFESICDPSWATKLQQIGDVTFERLSKFTLDREPDLLSVSVVVTLPDGTSYEIPRYDPTAVPPQFNGWALDPDNNVVFYGEAVPEAGARIEVSYQVMCLAP